MISRRVLWRSPAKVNLSLRVVGRRPDGYHLLDSFFAPIDLCDELTVTIDTIARGGPMDVSVRCDRAGVPQDASNLAARAAVAVLAEVGLGATMRIDIAKIIPPGSGLGGGSANAATMLRGLNETLALGIAPARLTALAVTLGADVPFFLVGAPARVRGIGERIEPVAGWAERALVVAVPPVAVATAWAFRAFAAASPAASGERDEAARLAAGEAPNADLCVNDLEDVVLPAFPAIAALKRRLLAAGARAAVMSGSGSAVVALADSLPHATALASAVAASSPGVAVHAVRTLAGPLEVDRLGRTA